MSWLDDLIYGVRTILTGGTAVTTRSKLNFVSGATVVDNAATESTDVTITGGVPSTRTITAGTGLTGGGDLSANRTINVGANADGSIAVNANDIQVGVLATDAQHGNRGNGSLHTVATGAANGFMPTAHWTLCDAATSAATAAALCKRDGAGGASFAALTCTSLACNGDSTFTKNAIGTAQTIGVTLQNTTAAALGAQQNSPLDVEAGRCWETTGGTSQVVDWGRQVVPIQGATASSEYHFRYRVNGGAWVDALAIKPISAGASWSLTFPTGAGYVTASAGNLAFSVPIGSSVVFDGSTALFRSGVGGGGQLTRISWGLATADVTCTLDAADTSWVFGWTAKAGAGGLTTFRGQYSTGAAGGAIVVKGGEGTTPGGHASLAGGDAAAASGGAGSNAYVTGGEGDGAGLDGNVGLCGMTSFGGGGHVVGVKDATTVPTVDPVGGFLLIGDAGTVKIRTADGTITTIAPASAETLAYREVFLAPEVAGTFKGNIVENVASASPTGQPTHPCNLRVSFPAGWEGGNIQVAGTRNGAAVSETFVANPGATVVGTEIFDLITTPNGITNTAPGGAGPDQANVETGVLLGVARASVAAFDKLYVTTVGVEAFAATTIAKGSFEPTSAKNGALNYEVSYRAAHTH